MPIYEYECRECGHFFEALVPRPGAKAPCPECGSGKVDKAISRPAPASVKGGGEVCDPPGCSSGP